MRTTRARTEEHARPMERNTPVNAPLGGWEKTAMVGLDGTIHEIKNAFICLISVPDYCYSEPCQNGGTCENGDDGFTCICPPGWQGETCEGERVFNYNLLKLYRYCNAPVGL